MAVNVHVVLKDKFFRMLLLHYKKIQTSFTIFKRKEKKRKPLESGS